MGYGGGGSKQASALQLRLCASSRPTRRASVCKRGVATSACIMSTQYARPPTTHTTASHLIAQDAVAWTPAAVSHSASVIVHHPAQAGLLCTYVCVYCVSITGVDVYPCHVCVSR